MKWCVSLLQRSLGEVVFFDKIVLLPLHVSLSDTRVLSCSICSDVCAAVVFVHWEWWCSLT